VIQGGKVNKDNDQRLSAIANLTAREIDRRGGESRERRIIASLTERKGREGRGIKLRGRILNARDIEGFDGKEEGGKAVLWVEY
jgi:DNA-binding MarR family transcriptional regulator